MKIDSKTFAFGINEVIPRTPGRKVTGITLHYTGGYTPAGSFATWKNVAEPKIGTPFIVARDGTTYQTFDFIRYWRWHLGVGNSAHDEATIGIEVDNIGWLKKKDDGLYDSYGKKFSGPVHVESFRGFMYWEKYPDVQMQSVVALVNHLCQVFGIPKTIPSPVHRERVWNTNEFPQLRCGINSHQQWRVNKFDVGPAFNWSLLE